MPAPVSLRSLDMLRGALATYVLLGHCRWLLWAGHARWMAQPHAAWLEPVVYASAGLRFGREAVMVFFVLSGFFIHLRAAQQVSPASARLEAASFFRRRAHRLGAPYAFALLLTLACDLVGRLWFPTLYAAATGDPLLDSVFRPTGYSWPSVAPALVVLPSSLGYDFGTNGPLWSLAFEVVYYALYPAWFALRRRSALAAGGLVPAGCLAAALLPVHSFPVTVLIHYPLWLAGAGLAELLSRHALPRVTPYVASVVFAAGLLLRIASGSTVVSVLAAVIFGAAAVCGFAALRDTATASAFGRMLERLGARSYTIYIVHFPFLALLSAALIETSGGRPMHGWFAVLGAAGALAFGCLCFEVCEKHFVHHLPAGRHAT